MTNLPVTREEAWELVKKYNSDRSDLNHYLESEAVLRAIAKKLGEDVDYYGMLGLLHDIDWEITKGDVPTHLTRAPEILKEAGFDSEFVENVISHGYGFPVAGLEGKKRTKKIEFALAAGETITGLVHATALMRPDKMEGMKVKSLKKKFKDNTFARGIHRNIIMEIENIEITIEEFMELAINAIYEIKKEVGLE